MAKVTLGGNPCDTSGELPKVGSVVPGFSLRKNDLGDLTPDDLKGQKVVLNIFPSIDTSTCATSVREFNKRASSLENVKIICVSRDLPFAQKRFCGAEGIENVMTASDFETGDFGKNFGLEITNGVLRGLHARAIVVIDENGVVKHTELVPEIVDEPNYEAALSSL